MWRLHWPQLSRLLQWAFLKANMGWGLAGISEQIHCDLNTLKTLRKRAGSRKHCFFSQKRMWDSSNSFRMNSQLKSHGVHHTCLQQIYSCTSILPTREWPQHSKSSQGLWTRCEQEDGEGEWGRLKARTKHRKNAIRIYFEPLQRPVNNGSSGVPEVSGISQPLSNSTAKTDSLSTFLD